MASRLPAARSPTSPRSWPFRRHSRRLASNSSTAPRQGCGYIQSPVTTRPHRSPSRRVDPHRHRGSGPAQLAFPRDALVPLGRMFDPVLELAVFLRKLLCHDVQSSGQMIATSRPEVNCLPNSELVGHRSDCPARPLSFDPENPNRIYGIDFHSTTAAKLTTGAGTTATAVTATGFQL